MRRSKLTAWSVAAGFVLAAILHPTESVPQMGKPNVQPVSSFPLKVAKKEPGQTTAADTKEEASKKKETAKSGIPTYKPPRLGRAWRTTGGATRSDGTVLPEIAVLAPNDHVGLSTKEEPILYWYISQPTTVPIVFTLIDETGIEPLLEVELSSPDQGGVQQVRLAEHGVRLILGERYTWSIALVRDPEHRSKDVVAEAGMQRVALSGDLRAKLALATEPEASAVYAEAGLWYDAIGTISTLIEADQADQHLRLQRAALLDQVSLSRVAAHDAGLRTSGPG